MGMNIFERAARAKLRFASTIGDLSTEQLWDLRLKANGSQLDLDTVARDVYRKLKDIGEESFVDETPDPQKAELELKLDIVKHVIESKKADIARAEKRAENAARKERLLTILAQKEDAELAGMSRKKLEKEIAELEGAA